MNEWMRIFSDRKRRIAILSIPLVCLVLFFFRKCNGNFGALIPEARDYRELLETYSGSTPAEITEAQENNWAPTRNEMRLLTQARHLRDYPGYLERVQKQAADMQASSLFGGNKNTFVYRNIIQTAEDFSRCSAEGVCLGNDRAVQDWLAFSWADWGFLAAILLLVMSFMEERKKGLAAILRSCPAGRGKLQASRLGVLLVYSAGMALLLYGLPLALSLLVDGGWSDLSRPVQSLAEFQKCTAQLTVSGFLLEFFLVKTACGLLLGMLFWFLLSFLEQVQLSWLVTAAGLAVEYLLYTLIPPQSLFSPLRYINVFSFVFSFRMYTQYVNINFFGFPVALRTLLLGLLAGLVTVLGAATVWVLTRRYPFGNRDRMGKWLHLWNRMGDGVRRHLGIYGFEWYKLLFLSAGGLFLILGAFLTRDIRVNSGAYNRLEDYLYRQYVAEIQGPVTKKTFDYLAEARQSLEFSDMDTAEFEAALDRVEQTVEGLDPGAWIVDEAKFLNIYGSKAWRTQRKNGLLAMIFLTVCLSALYACDQSGDVRKVLRSTAGGRKRLFRAKYATALGITALVWLLVFGREWRAAVSLMGDTLLSAPCGSIGILKGFPMTIRSFLILLWVSKGVALLVPMHLCIFIGEHFRSFEKAFLVGCVTLLIPAAACFFGAHAIRRATPMTFVADGNLLLSGKTGLFWFALWMLLSLLALFAARREWDRSA